MSIFIVFKIYKALITLKMPETVIVSGIFCWQLLKIRTILPIIKTAN